MDDSEQAEQYRLLLSDQNAIIEFVAEHHPDLLVDEDAPEPPMNRAARRSLERGRRRHAR